MGQFVPSGTHYPPLSPVGRFHMQGHRPLAAGYKQARPVDVSNGSQEKISCGSTSGPEYLNQLP